MSRNQKRKIEESTYEPSSEDESVVKKAKIVPESIINRAKRLNTKLLDLQNQVQKAKGRRKPPSPHISAGLLQDLDQFIENETPIQDLELSLSTQKSLLKELQLETKDPIILNYITLSLRPLEEFQESYTNWVNTKPSPSRYALEWDEAQEHPNPIYCLRPTTMRGIPITTLHHAFATFAAQCKKPLPSNMNAMNALKAAMNLCSIMGNYYPDEGSRGSDFDKAVAPLFEIKSWERQVGVSDGLVSGRVDRVWRISNTNVMLREDKPEYGEGYMQVARDYELLGKGLVHIGQSHRLIRGVPLFLTTLIGPQLTIAGGFFDGDTAVVEPIGQCLSMLPDYNLDDGRPMILAQHLYALYVAVYQIYEWEQDSSRISPHGNSCPRTYDTVQDDQGHEIPVQLIEPLKDLWNTNCLFRAKCDNKPALAKLCFGRYGKDVHSLLATHNLAPMIYGLAALEGAPSMVVMEHLERPEWSSLFEWTKKFKKISVYSKSVLSARLEKVLGLLKDNDMVHGDLRLNNIMVKFGDDGELVDIRVIDFDWSGKVGVVKYPVGRNDKLGLPGAAGEEILLTHDRENVDTWLAKL